MGAPASDPGARLEHALGLAYRYLGPRARTEVELRRHLEGRSIGPATIEQALATLLDQGYLDDGAFARQFVEDKRTLERWGEERIARRLQDRGVPHELAEAALGSRERGDELAAARALLTRRFPALTDDPSERRRALGLLVRRGYEFELAGDAVRAHVRAD